MGPTGPQDNTRVSLPQPPVERFDDENSAYLENERAINNPGAIAARSPYGRIENTFGPLDYLLGTFPLGRGLSAAANRVAKALGIDDMAVANFGFGKMRPGPSEAAVGASENAVKQAEDIIEEMVLSEISFKHMHKFMPHIFSPKQSVQRFYNPNAVELVGDDLGGKAFYRAMRESNIPMFQDYLQEMKVEVVKKLTERLGRTPFSGKNANRDMYIAEEMLDEMMIPYWQKVLSRPPGKSPQILTDRLLNPDNAHYKPYKFNAMGGRIAVDPTGPDDTLTFPRESLIRGMYMESSFDPKAKSSAGAQGLAQITPITVKEMKRLKLVDEDFDPFDPKDAREGQEAYLNYLITRNEGTDEVRLAKAAAAYNYGQGNLNKFLSDQAARGVDTMRTLDWVNSLNNETRDYVNAVVLGNFPESRDDYEQLRPRYFEFFPDVEDPRSEETTEPKNEREISQDLYNAIQILKRDNPRNYRIGGQHPTGPEEEPRGIQMVEGEDGVLRVPEREEPTRPSFRTDAFNTPTDPDVEYLNEKIGEARKMGTGLKTRQRPKGEDENLFEYQEFNPNYTMTDPYQVTRANEYYRAAYSDPTVIEALNSYFDQSDPDGREYKQQMENLRGLYPNASDATLGDLLARRSRDIMSSVSDYALVEDRPGDWGSVTDRFTGPGTTGGTDAGSKQNPIWMGLGDVQRRGASKLQVDQLPDQGDRRSVTTHEMSHAQDRSGRYLPPAMVDYMSNLRLDRSEAKDYDGEQMSRRRFDYITSPTETRARLQDLRQQVFDLRGGEFNKEVDKETLDKLRKEPAYKDLVGAYGEEGLLDLINNVYEHGGRHDDPPNYSRGQQVLDYLAGYGQARAQEDNRFDATLQDITDFFMSRQGQAVSTKPRTRYEFGVGSVPRMSQREEFDRMMDELMVTNDKSEALKYITNHPLLYEDTANDPEYRSFVAPGEVDKETGERITREESLTRNLDPETRFSTRSVPVVYNYLSENPSARSAAAEEFYHANQMAANKAMGRLGDLGMGIGTQQAFNELMDMENYAARGKDSQILGVEGNRTFDTPTLYQANEPADNSDKGYFDRVHRQSIGDGAKQNNAWYYFGTDKAEGDAAINSGIYFAREMGILPEGEITAQDLPEVLERFKGYTATQSGRTEFNPSLLKDWKPDGRKIVKFGKDGEMSLTKYGEKWMQDPENKKRFRQRAMPQQKDREARLDNPYMRMLEDIITDAVNQQGMFDPDRMNPDIARQGYEDSLNSSYLSDRERKSEDHPGNRFSSGKMPIDLLLEIINTGGSYSKSNRERTAEQELLEGRRGAREEYDRTIEALYGQQ